MFQTTAYGLTMRWSVVMFNRHTPVLRGYIDREQRLSCQLSKREGKRWTCESVEPLVIDRLKQISEGG